jgi:hypothetical protein
MDTAQLIEQSERRTADLEAKMQRLGFDVKPLQVAEVEPGLHEKAEGITMRPIYLLSWRKEPTRLFGRWSVPNTERVSEKFIKLPVAQINIPRDTAQRYKTISTIAEVDESAVFLSTRLADSDLSLILAVRIMNQWLKLYQWRTSWTKLGISRPEVCQMRA